MAPIVSNDLHKEAIAIEELDKIPYAFAHFENTYLIYNGTNSACYFQT